MAEQQPAAFESAAATLEPEPHGFEPGSAGLDEETSYCVTAGGKYDRDGHFDPNLVSRQCGAMVILRRMVDRGFGTVLTHCARSDDDG